MSPLPPDKITLEDLLRLKRAERPPAEFWVQFDRELHAKQLAALVEKKPHWSFAVGRLARFASVPLSAAAVCALTFFALRPAADEIAHAGRSPLPARPIALRPASIKAPVAAIPSAPQEALIGEKTPAPAPSMVQPATLVSTASVPSEISPAISQLTAALWQTAKMAPSSTRSMMTADLALAQMAQLSDPASPSISLESFGGGKMRPTADPLAQVSAPGEMRHARILAALTDTRPISAIEPASVSHTRERIASRLANEGFAADDISRLGVEGTQVSFRF